MYNNKNDDDIKQRVKQKAKNVACLQASLRAYKEKDGWVLFNYVKVGPL